MTIAEEQLKEILEPRAEIEVLSTISSDGKNLLTRVPKNVVEKTNLKKRQTLRWLADSNKDKISLEIVRDDD